MRGSRMKPTNQAGNRGCPYSECALGLALVSIFLLPGSSDARVATPVHATAGAGLVSNDGLSRSSEVEYIIQFDRQPGKAEYAALGQAGAHIPRRYRAIPMAAVRATRSTVARLSALPTVSHISL